MEGRGTLQVKRSMYDTGTGMGVIYKQGKTYAKADRGKVK